MSEVVVWVTEESGLQLPAEHLAFDIHPNPRGRVSCQGKIGYRGPVSPTASSAGWPKEVTGCEASLVRRVRGSPDLD